MNDEISSQPWKLSPFQASYVLKIRLIIQSRNFAKNETEGMNECFIFVHENYSYFDIARTKKELFGKIIFEVSMSIHMAIIDNLGKKLQLLCKFLNLNFQF